MKTHAVQEKDLCPVQVEFPVINEAFRGRKNRYFFAGTMAERPGEQEPLFDGVIKYDTQARTWFSHNYGAKRFGGEPCFVPRPGGTGTTREEKASVPNLSHDSRGRRLSRDVYL